MTDVIIVHYIGSDDKQYFKVIDTHYQLLKHCSLDENAFIMVRDSLNDPCSLSDWYDCDIKFIQQSLKDYHTSIEDVCDHFIINEISITLEEFLRYIVEHSNPEYRVVAVV